MQSNEHEESKSPLGRVAIVHSFYSSRSPSGENVAVRQHYDVLRKAGYDVQLFAQRTDQRETRWTYPLEAAWTVATGIGPNIQLGEFQPEIIHVHNTFPNYGKGWISEVSTPIVASLHNYRSLCSNGLFFRDGKVCTDCLEKKSSIPAVVHGCYNGRKKTIPVAIGQRFERDKLLKGASKIIALSTQMKDFYVQAGVPQSKLEILSNFLPDELDSGAGDGGDYWLYAGRLSAEKGILRLLDAWPKHESLVVVGTGDQLEEVEAKAGANINLMGAIDREALIGLMKGAKGLVFPSECYEGFPMVYAEALAAGTPILTWEPSVMCALVRDDQTGFVGDMDNMESDIAKASVLFPTIREHCRLVFESKYTEKAWISNLEGIYDDAKSST